MSYLEKHLMAGETIVYRSRVHWILFWHPILHFTLTAILAAWGCLRFKTLSPFVAHWGPKLILVLFALAALTAVKPLLEYLSCEFAVTSKRVVMKTGFLRMRSLELLLSKVEAVQVEQSVWGRILGFGSIILVGSGGTKEIFHLISNPLRFCKNVQEQISAHG